MRDDGVIHNGCVRLSPKLLPTRIESGHSSIDASSLMGPAGAAQYLLLLFSHNPFLQFLSSVLRSASVNHLMDP